MEPLNRKFTCLGADLGLLLAVAPTERYRGKLVSIDAGSGDWSEKFIRVISMASF